MVSESSEYQLLPPIPNRVTGEPRPPAAPRTESSANESTPTTRSPLPPTPVPTELGPILEWAQPTRFERLKWIVGLVGIMAVFATAANGPDWVLLWQPWVFVVVFAGFLYWRFRSDFLAAGATWVQVDKSWVDTYELVEIAFSISGLNRVLLLKDSSGRQIYSFRLRNVQAHPQMWDLAYNGILHSVASGNCQVTPRARRILRLPAGLGE